MYVAQLTLPPANVMQLERSSLQRVMHMATNVLVLDDFYYLQSGGGPNLRSLSTAIHASMLRTACVTIPSWREWCRQLEIAAKECASGLEVCAAPSGGVSPGRRR